MKLTSKMTTALLLGGLSLLLILTLAGHVGAQTCVPPPAGLVSWWPGEGDANDIADGNHGTLSGVTFAAGKVGQSFQFDGVDDQISMGDVLDLGLDSFSVDAWVIRQPSNGSMRVVGTFVTGSPGWDFAIRSSGTLILFLSGSGSTTSILQSVSTDTVPADGQFHLVAATVDRAANNVSLFIDGVEVSAYDEKNTVANFDSTTSIASSTPMTVGRRPDGLNPYNGSIDELEMFTGVLTGSEIQAIFDADAAGKCKVTTVELDIKPGSFPNSINPRSRGVIPVAILTTETFDATTMDPNTITFGPDGTAPVHHALEDVDADGDTDLILHFNARQTGIQCGDTSATLTGETFGGQAIEGSDSIKTVGCK